MKKIFILFLISIFFLVSIGFVNAQSCDTVGQILNNQYCGTDGQWHNQLADEDPCENNFECLSDNCIEGTCSEISVKEEYEKQKGLLSQIWGWLSPPSNGAPGADGYRSGGAGNRYEVDKIFSHINPFRLYCFNINEIPIPVTKLCFITNTELSDVKFNVKRILENDLLVAEPEGLIYQYFQINTENIEDHHLEKADITFKVTKDWIEQNDLKTYKVILQRYTAGWNTNKPQIIAEDSLNYYYNAGTPGFSYFAITSMPKKPSIPYTPPAAVCGDGIIDTDENCETCPEDVICLKNEVCENGRCIEKTRIWSYLLPILVILILFMLFIIIIYLVSKKKKTIILKKEKPKPKPQTIVGNKFKNIRLKEGLKKAAVARAGGISTSTVSNIEENKKIKELSKRAALRGINTLIERKTGVKNKYSYEQVFRGRPSPAVITKKLPLFPSKTAETNLRNYVRKALKAKMSKKRIKKILMSKGWKEKQVEFIFKHLKK